MAIKGTVCLAWLDPGEVASDFAISISDLSRARGDILTGRINVRSGGGITRGRNRAVAQFLDGCTDDWLLFVDADMSFTVDDFNLVAHHAHERKAPIVGGLCFGQDGYYAGSFPTLVPTLFVGKPDGGYAAMHDYPDSAMVEVDATGCAFLLIHRSVLEKIRKDVGLGKWSWFGEYPHTGIDSWVSEDVVFCELAKASGFPIFVHTGAKIGHVKGTNYVLDESMYRMLRAATAGTRADS